MLEGLLVDHHESGQSRIGVISRLLWALLPDRNPFADDFLCRWGIHPWTPECANCLECGMPDWFLIPNAYLEWKRLAISIQFWKNRRKRGVHRC